MTKKFQFENRMAYPQTWFRLDPEEEVLAARFIQIVQVKQLDQKWHNLMDDMVAAVRGATKLNDALKKVLAD